ncbi:type IV conjugative transfer system pilin TraA [Photobacterium profundum]|jgi:type IV conjugative transfer system pilin TraA|uniref:Pilin n=1 Tax=Photobacterium profundum (strain SS9) TaxID=298386 RepID=Q6LW94_PHOPR|nr:type IV conjugative transfer system pilin TraA [Photobacterium profundum]CAG17941.1 hypothetical protein PBPRC0003 [Photobacterium profundum SS9]
MSTKLGVLIIATGVALAISQPALAADIFAGSKTVIKENADGDSGLYMGMTVAGLGSAALGGFLTKNWGGAIGGFVTGMIFANTAMAIVGL